MAEPARGKGQGAVAMATENFKILVYSAEILQINCQTVAAAKTMACRPVYFLAQKHTSRRSGSDWLRRKLPPPQYIRSLLKTGKKENKEEEEKKKPKKDGEVAEAE